MWSLIESYRKYDPATQSRLEILFLENKRFKGPVRSSPWPKKQKIRGSLIGL